MGKLYSLQFNFAHKLAIFVVILAIFSSSFPQTVKAGTSTLDHWNFGYSQEPDTGLPQAQTRSPRRVVMALVTAYSSTVDQTDDTPFETANGKQVYDGLVAANWLPFGTHIKIPELYGDKIFTVNDRMNAKYTSTNVDIWMGAPRHIVDEFGAKRLRVEIY